MLGLRLGRFEGASQQENTGILQRLRHLRVRETLVQHKTVNQFRILELSTCLGLQKIKLQKWKRRTYGELNQIEADIATREIGNSKDRTHGNLSHLTLEPTHENVDSHNSTG